MNISDIIAGKDISLRREDVDISSKDNVYNSEEKHEYKRSRLTVSVGGAAIDAINSVVQPITRASEVKDKRLAGLYAVKAGQEVSQIAKTYKNQQDVIDSLTDKAGKESDLFAKGKDWKEADKVKDNQLGGKNTFTLNVGIGTSHSQAESHSETKEAAGSHVSATGDVTIKAIKDDIRIKGSQVSGENVTLDAKKDIDISAAENSNTIKETTKSSGASLGASIGVGGLQGVSASYSKAKGHIKENETTYEKSQVTASKELTFTSGKDTTITGSEMTGEKVTGNVGGNLSIETKQDKKTYEEKSTSTGLSINYGVKSGKISASGGVSKDTIHSNYESATDQAGIHARSEGFDITVKDNTRLKGGVIDSNAAQDKNILTTGTLSWKDTENKADYKESGAGLTINTDKDAKYNEKGITPAIPTGSKDKASSTTKSAIAEGTIEITDKTHQKQDISELNRDTKNSLNQLGEIFDKTKVSERQELAGLFGEMAFNQLHNAKLTPNQRSAWHAFLGGIMGALSNKDFLGGATAAGINEMLIKQIEKASHGDPALMQWMSATVGGITGELVSKNPQLGAGTASNGTKNNDELDAELAAANNESSDDVQKESEVYVPDQDSALDEEEKVTRNSMALEVIRSSVSAGIISDPATMKYDYTFGKIEGGAFKVAGLEAGYIIDKKGGVYRFVGASMSIVVGSPISLGTGVGKLNDDKDLINGISGNSVGIGGSSLVGVSISKGVGSDSPITVEIVTETAAGTNVSWRYTEYIGNIND